MCIRDRFTGVLVGLVLLDTIVTWGVDGPDPVNLVATIVIAACWGLTMARSRWAWVVLPTQRTEAGNVVVTYGPRSAS